MVMIVFYAMDARGLSTAKNMCTNFDQDLRNAQRTTACELLVALRAPSYYTNRI